MTITRVTFSIHRESRILKKYKIPQWKQKFLDLWKWLRLGNRYLTLNLSKSLTLNAVLCITCLKAACDNSTKSIRMMIGSNSMYLSAVCLHTSCGTKKLIFDQITFYKKIAAATDLHNSWSSARMNCISCAAA